MSKSSDQGQLTDLIKEMDKVNVDISSAPSSVNFKNLIQDLVESNSQQFSFMISSRSDSINQRKIERIYSKNEIRQMVSQNLIDEYQHQNIIDAVTEYLYGIHISV